MPKIGQIGACLAVVGIALAVQGCWGEDEQRLTLLGDGGCRTAEGGEGNQVPVSVASVDECKAKCFNENGSCAAVEYNASSDACEIHSAPITTYEQVDGVECYALR
jgi:hypothetical protein